MDRSGGARLIALAVMITFAAAMASGCWDRRELEDQGFVLSLGVDKAPESALEITARIAIPRNLAGGGSGRAGGDGGKSSELITIRAETLEGALNLLGPLVGRRVSLAHLMAVVVSEDLAREGIAPVIRGLLRFREARRTIHFAVARGKAREVMERNRPSLDKNMARFVFNVDETSRFNALVPTSLLHRFVADLQKLDRDPVAALVAVNPKASGESAGLADERSRPGGTAETEAPFAAGEMPRKGGNPVEFIGTAVFRGDRLVGTLNGEETRILLSIRGEFRRSYFSFPDPEVEGSFVVVELRRGKRPQYRVAIEDGRPSILETILLEVDLLAVPSGVDYTGPEKMAELERQIETLLDQQARALVEKAQKEFRADPFAFGSPLKREFGTRSDWENYDWPSQFPGADISVKFVVKLRRPGLQLAPTTPAPR